MTRIAERRSGRHAIGALMALPLGAIVALLPAAALAVDIHVGLRYAEGCRAYDLPLDRCTYIVEWARQQAGIDPSEDVEIRVLGDPACPDDAPGCSVTRSQQFLVRVRFIRWDGSSGEASVYCGVTAAHSYLCTDDPVIARHSPTIDGGYGDIPCADPEGVDCASPLPPPDPAAVAAAQPLEIPELSIPIDHAGVYSVVVGEAVLPNGLLSDASFEPMNRPPDELLLTPDGISMVITSLEDGQQLVNVYQRGRREGTERVRVTLVFAVELFEPGVSLVLTDLVVA
jgi:hypothetical protein